ncbi:hypothetical protein A2714_02695 [Candidatus Woesebacteria bacterium RIFCSPHIGHO2_01_FULL_38_9]|uniref:dolichyl-phosphate beta-glucosyltransferase n=2 Tax=Candidatus Woeseibacteriota TaxID=1752722 RepID=A0A1F7Y3K0_9BACT|nr:MAG: hypothetical protein A2714_02695 [Candidatus Woesebacteria bacterium RIFCSPHIGHO2_01_FULL_38_9]OGM59687.1 MAG: hypothetical protein A3A75_00895 [Candidatus Woesebacteria bacterium RIFCSPLOWO2_01_FULL_39_10]
MKPYLSVIIPVYNEEKRIKNLKKIDRFLQSFKYTSEIVLVNDGSNDKTEEILLKISLKTPLKIISYDKNMGKGHAVKKGMLKARGLYLLFMDVDLSTSPSDLPKFLKRIKEYDVVIGSRKIEGANVFNRQSFVRESLGKSFTLLSRRTLGLDISDFTCGFKCFTKDAALNIFNKVTIDRWGFDPEVLFIANKLGYRILEIPVKWRNDPNTKVRFPQDIIRSLRDLIKIRANSIKGVYSKT